MKSIKTLLVLMILFKSQLLHAQTKDDYLLKSRHQKTSALIMVTGGIAITTVGILSAAAGSLANALRLDGTKRVRNAGSVLVITGAAAIIGSIPLFVASGKNIKKAMNVTFTNQPIPVLVSNITKRRSMPSIALRFNL